MTLLPLIGNPSIANEDGYWIINIWAYKDKANTSYVFEERSLVDTYVFEKKGTPSNQIGFICQMASLALIEDKAREHHKSIIKRDINEQLKMLSSVSSLIKRSLNRSISEHKLAYRNASSFRYSSECVLSKGFKELTKVIDNKSLLGK